MSDIVKIKGVKAGLQLTFAKEASFEDVEKNLTEKLESGNKFFIRGTTVFIPKDHFEPEQNEILKKLFHRNGMLFSTAVKTPKFTSSSTSSRKNESVQQMTVIKRTIRGGEEVEVESSLMIFGNVNPGAHIVAGGSIDIRGTCRGVVHAGAFGDESAIIVADRLMPTQIRIADIIARSPDNMEKAETAERAFIKDGHIAFEPINR